jgi:hypothetical protein
VAPTPPIAHGNFTVIPRVVRDPYEYSAPGAPEDFLPQGVTPEGEGHSH